LAFFLVFDVTRLSTFSNIKTWIEELREYADPNIVTMLIGNKTDLDWLRVVPTEVAESFATENGMMYMETSASSTSNVEAAFEKVLTEVYHIVTNKRTEPSHSSSRRPRQMIDRHFFDI